MTKSSLPYLSLRQQWLLLMLILLGAIACCGAVLWQLLYNGPFLLHVSLPQFWQGGIEALVLIATLAVLQFWRKHGWRTVASLLIVELYLRRHAVDAALLLDLVYFELVFALGACVMRACGGARPVDLTGYLRAFVLGFCAWSTCAWTISALGHGSVTDLRALTFVLCVPAIALRSTPACIFVARQLRVMPTIERSAAMALVGWFLILFAHSATAIGFDSSWYGLRPERVLVGAGSAFAPQGLVMPVFYFPKVYELFLVPLSGLGSSSVIAGISIGSLALLAAACNVVLRRLGLHDVLARFAGISLVVTLPAVANYALELKPDVFSAFLIVFAWQHAADFVRTRSPSALCWLLSLLALSVQAKLTAIPFVAAFVAATAIAWLRVAPAAHSPSQPGERRIALFVFVTALAISVFATVRTLLLAGVPTVAPEPLLRLWHLLGLELAFPVGRVQWEFPKDWTDTPLLAFDLLFRPQLMVKIIVTWPGNVWLWLGTVALTAASFVPKPKQDDAGIIAASTLGMGLMLAAFMLMLCWGYDFRGGDGNYFVAGVVPAILLGVGTAWRRLSTLRAPRVAFLTAISAFALFQASYSFLSAAWSPGTRAFDLKFDRSVRALRQRDRRDFAEQGVARIAAHLRSLKHTARVIGCTPPDDGLGFRLPAAYEGFGQLLVPRLESVNTMNNFLAFLKADRIEYLLLPIPAPGKKDCGGLTVLVQTAAELDKNSQVPALRDDGYVLYDLTKLR